MKAQRVDIKAVEMVRRIRDEHYEQLRDKRPEERMAFYRAKARRFQTEIAPSQQEQPANQRLMRAPRSEQ